MKGDHRREVNGRRWGGFYSWMQFLGFPHFVVLSKVCLWRFDGGLWHWARETAAPRGGPWLRCALESAAVGVSAFSSTAGADSPGPDAQPGVRARRLRRGSSATGWEQPRVVVLMRVGWWVVMEAMSARHVKCLAGLVGWYRRWWCPSIMSRYFEDCGGVSSSRRAARKALPPCPSHDKPP